MSTPNDACAAEGGFHSWDGSARIIKRLLNEYTNNDDNKILALDHAEAKDTFTLNSCVIVQK